MSFLDENGLSHYNDLIENKLAGKVSDVQVNSFSIVINGVANIPKASSSSLGVVKGGTTGIGINNDGQIFLSAASEAFIKSGTNTSAPIVPNTQHSASFYGLAKAAGDSTQSASENTVGTYTSAAKSAIQTMLNVPDADAVVSDVTINGTSVVNDGVAEIPVADITTLGAVKVNQTYGIHITPASWGNSYTLMISQAIPDQIKAGANTYKPITPYIQHQAAFYGLAKAAGVDMASSSNAVGTYTETAKAAIKNMLGVSGESQTITVSGTTPTITAQPNTRYICGEVLSLDFTPCVSGICNVVFTSGSTVTVLSLPQTVKMPEWFEVETNTTYEISIMDGVYGAVMSWAI